MKECITCLTNKDLNLFPKGQNSCKECKSIYIKKYYLLNKEILLSKEKERYKKNSDKKISYQKDYAQDNKEHIKEYLKVYRQSNSEILKVKRKEYNKKNSEQINLSRRKRYKERYQTDLNFKLKLIHRNILKRTLNDIKVKRTSELLGYTSEELRFYLESKFIEDMSWENYGEWEIDHIKPITAFDLINTPANIVSALLNLQPLWKIDNIKKGNNYDI